MVIVHSEELSALRPTPKLEDHPLSVVTAYSIHLQLICIMEAVSQTATWGHTMQW